MHLSSELTANVSGTLVMDLITFAARPAAPAASATKAVRVGGGTSEMVWRVALDELYAKARTDRNHTIARIRFNAAPAASAGAATASPPLTTYAWLSLPKDAKLVGGAGGDEGVHVTDVRVSAGGEGATVRVEATVTAAYVVLESMAVVGAFDDGAFVLLAGETRDLTFTARGPFDLGAFKAGLRVRSLCGTSGAGCV